MVEVAPIRIRDLGVLRIDVEGVQTTAGGARPAQVLALLLIHANRRVSTDALITAMWGDDVADARKAAGTLESHIWRLRKLMEPARERRKPATYLVNDVGGYRLVVNPDNADSLRFEQLARQGDDLLQSGEAERALRSYDRALELWRGRPFEDVADHEWAIPAIGRLEERHDHVREQRLEALLRSGEHGEALRGLESMIEVTPFRERLWAQLMLGLYQAGRIEEALGAYLRAREALLDNVGVEPGPELVRLQQRMLDRDPTLAPDRPAPVRVRSAAAPSVNLPVRLSPLIGRRHEVGRLTTLLQRYRLVTLVGAGGCGKTRLAIELARGAAPASPDGVFFIDLSAALEPASVAATMVSSMGIAASAVGGSLAAVRSYVRDRQVLLVLDNCEQVLGEVRRVVASLLAEDSLCRILTTSREPVGIDGEVLWSVAPLAVRRDDEPGTPRSEAAQLFWSKVDSVDPQFDGGDVADSQVEQICAAVDGLPLAIELAAGRIRTSSLPEIVRQVSEGLAGLARDGLPGAEHHRTIETSIEWSARLLSGPERAVHARLSVLPGLFTVAAAAAVVGFDEIGPDAIPPLLQRLVHRSLLAVVPPSSPEQSTRFRQLATVRSHANRLLQSRHEIELAVDSRTAWLRNLLDARPGFEEFDTDGWHDSVREDFDTVAAVLRHTLVEHPEPFGVHAAARLWFYFFSDRLVEGQRWMGLALTQSGAEPADTIEVQLGLASSLVVRDRTDLAVPMLRQALAHAHLVDHRRLAEGLMSTAYNAWIRQHPDLDFTHAVIEGLAAADPDPALALYADMLAVLDSFPVVGPAAAAAEARDLDRRASELGQQWTTRCSGWLRLICALLTGDAAAAVPLCELNVERTLQATNTIDHVTFEARGDTAIVAGDLAGGVRLLGWSRSIAYRNGNLWPLSGLTKQLLERARVGLPPELFDAAWRDGEAGQGI